MSKPVCKVVLVEDDQNMLAVLRTLLELEGFQVALAPGQASQEELVAQITSAQPDAVFMDVGLGMVSGLDVLQDLRANPATASARLIMTSGSAIKENCLAAGADDFVMKPYLPDELIRKLRGA